MTNMITTMFTRSIQEEFSVSNLMKGALTGMLQKGKETAEKKQIFSNFLKATDPS